MLLLYGPGGSNILLSNESLYYWVGLNPQLGLGSEPLNPGGLGCVDTLAPVRYQGSWAVGAEVSWIPAGGSIFGTGWGNLHYWMPSAHQFR